ncbi:MAG: HupE/UreJ family protein [Dongiaceae bacterium]
MSRAILLVVATAIALLSGGGASAHKPSDSYLGLQVDGSIVAGSWKIALRDLDYAIGLDGNDDGAITWGELRERFGAIDAYALSRLTVTSMGRDCPLNATDHLVDNLSDGAYAVLRFDAACAGAVERLAIGYSLLFDVDQQHRGLLNLRHQGETRTAIFSPHNANQHFDLKVAPPGNPLTAYWVEGVWHIWVGYDHILFILTLLLPAVLRREGSRWLPVAGLRQAFVHTAGIVTAFTVAHSITLSLATLDVINLPSRLVESVIAASIIVAAFNNLVPIVTRRLWLVAFIFGLVHGLGFASVLADLGLPSGSLALALLGFNLGVETGQLAIVAAFLPVAFLLCGWQFYPRTVLQVGSAAIAGVACLWFIQRAFDIALI